MKYKDDDKNKITTGEYKKMLSRFEREPLLYIRRIGYALLKEYLEADLTLDTKKAADIGSSNELDLFIHPLPITTSKSVFENMIHNWCIFRPIEEQDSSVLNEKEDDEDAQNLWAQRGGYAYTRMKFLRRKYEIHQNNLRNLIRATEQLAGEPSLFQGKNDVLVKIETNENKVFLKLISEKNKEEKSKPYFAGLKSSIPVKLLSFLSFPNFGEIKSIDTTMESVGYSEQTLNFKEKMKKLQGICKELQRNLSDTGFKKRITLNFEPQRKTVKMQLADKKSEI